MFVRGSITVSVLESSLQMKTRSSGSMPELDPTCATDELAPSAATPTRALLRVMVFRPPHTPGNQYNASHLPWRAFGIADPSGCFS